jgi:hypothetical protein
MICLFISTLHTALISPPAIKLINQICPQYSTNELSSKDNTERRFSFQSHTQEQFVMHCRTRIYVEEASIFVVSISASCWKYWASILSLKARCVFLLFPSFISQDAIAPSGPRPPHCRGSTIILRHTTPGSTSQYER